MLIQLLGRHVGEVGVLLISTPIAFMGCAEEGAAQQLAVLQRPVISQPEDELPGPADFPLKVCFRPKDEDGNTDVGDGTQADRDAVRARAEGAWTGLPRSAVSFTGWATCGASEPSGVIRINLDTSVTRGLYSWVQGNMKLPINNTDWGVSTTIHEFGHALGLVHEHAHPDSTCDEDEDDIPTGGIILTDYDPAAVMDYCSGVPTQITDRERLFIEMAYPDGTFNYSLSSSAGYSVGSILLVRHDTELHTEWTHRGALPAAYSEVHWYAGAQTFDAVTIVASQLSIGFPGWVSVDHDFVDFRGQSRNGLARAVTVSDSLHTAITMSAL